MAITVVLVEDHHLVRSGIRSLLERSPEIQVIGEAADGREAIQLCQKLHPRIVLMDVAMPDLNGIDAARQICAELPEVRVIMLSMYDDRQHVFESLKAGAAGYVLKGGGVADLLLAIQTVNAGKNYLSAPLNDVVMNDYVRRAQGNIVNSDLEKISAREREVLQLIAEGNSSAEVAAVLHISVRTVDTHRQNVMDKLGIHSIAQLTKFAIRNGLTSLKQ
jgi:DNA-binding NarL/FixJ family response regulator